MTNEPCLDCTKQLIQAELAEVHYWHPYPLEASRQELRHAMRIHAAEKDKRPTIFKPWTAPTSLLELDTRYQAIKQRLADYIAASA